MMNEFIFENHKDLNGPAVEASKRLCREAKFIVPVDRAAETKMEFVFVDAKQPKTAEVAA